MRHSWEVGASAPERRNDVAAFGPAPAAFWANRAWLVIPHRGAAWACSNSRSPSTLNAITTATMHTHAASAGSG
jgi:hypothetical protein